MDNERRERILIKVAGLPRYLANQVKRSRRRSRGSLMGDPFSFGDDLAPRAKQWLRGHHNSAAFPASPNGKSLRTALKSMKKRRLLASSQPSEPGLIYDTSATHGGKKHWRPASGTAVHPMAERLKAYKALKHQGEGPQTIQSGWAPSPGPAKKVSPAFRWGDVKGASGSEWGTQTPGTKYIKKALKSSPGTKGPFRRYWVPGGGGDNPAYSPGERWALRKTEELRAAGAPVFKNRLPPKRSVIQRTKGRLFPPPQPLTPAEMQSTLTPPVSTNAQRRKWANEGDTPHEIAIADKAYAHMRARAVLPGRAGEELQKRVDKYKDMRERAQVLRGRRQAGEISPELNRYLGGEAFKRLKQLQQPKLTRLPAARRWWGTPSEAFIQKEPFGGRSSYVRNEGRDFRLRASESRLPGQRQNLPADVLPAEPQRRYLPETQRRYLPEYDPAPREVVQVRAKRNRAKGRK